MDPQTYKWEQRGRRADRIRKKVSGTPERPRLSVYRSLANLYAQVIDDTQGRTLGALSTRAKDVKAAVGYGGNRKAAEILGTRLAGLGEAKGVTKGGFDRGAARYHGRVRMFWNAAKKAGLNAGEPVDEAEFAGRKVRKVAEGAVKGKAAKAPKAEKPKAPKAKAGKAAPGGASQG